jgi:hypothetical protein
MLVDAPSPALSGRFAGAAVEQAVSRPAVLRTIERLTLIIFWLLIMEGSLRKWVAPQLANVLFFIRDPFVLAVYWVALRGGLFKQIDPLLKIGLVFAGIAPILALMQIANVGDSRIGAIVAYGWRQYFLYLPLPFVIARAFDRSSQWRFARHAFIAVVLTAPMVFAQFHSPAGSVLNRGSADDEALQFKSFDLIGEHIRPSGFFTTNVGVVQLIPSTLALLLGAWLTPARRRSIRLPMMVLAAGGIVTCLAFSGSRTAFVYTSLVFISCLLAGLLVRDGKTRMRALGTPAILIAAGVVLYPILFPDAFQAMTERVLSSDTFGQESGGLGIFGRALYETVDFMHLMGTAPVVGYGLGLGGNGHTFLGQAGEALLQGAYAESDWTRHIVDLGPAIGLLFILYRIGLTLEVFRRCVQATIRGRDPVPILLFGYIGIGVFYGQLTGHGIVGGFLWIYLGVTLASCKIAMESKVAEEPA